MMPRLSRIILLWRPTANEMSENAWLTDWPVMRAVARAISINLDTLSGVMPIIIAVPAFSMSVMVLMVLLETRFNSSIICVPFLP